MKLLIDENLPKRLKNEFSENKIYTVFDMKWTSKKNGELLKLMVEEKFDVLLTFDKNLQFQQNFSTYPVSVFIISAPDNTFLSIQPLIPMIKKKLKERLKPGATIIKNT